jgi:hypothetical protein
MTMHTIAVVQYGALWRPVQDDRRYGEALPYGDALKYAERLARLSHWQGLDVEVLVHQGGELRPHLQLRAFVNGSDRRLALPADGTAPAAIDLQPFDHAAAARWRDSSSSCKADTSSVRASLPTARGLCPARNVSRGARRAPAAAIFVRYQTVVMAPL